jgi:uncharacterized protein involved in exopolysaccharide biosynthesis
MEEEIDLRPYVEALLKRWYWIGGVVVLAAFITFLFIRLSPPTYEAKSSIAIIRSRTDVSFDPRMLTLSEGELSSLNADSNSRRNALIGLVKSNAVAEQVFRETGELLPVNMRNISHLLEMVEVESEGDLIHILVQYRDADIAAQLANTWAQSFEQIANKLYGTGDDANLSLVVGQIETAAADYEESQRDMEAFIRDNEIEFLQREIDANNEILNAYQLARDNIQSGAIKLQSDNQQLTLAAYYNDLQQVELWLIEAEALRELVSTGQNSDAERLANTLAFISLQGEIFGGSMPVQLQVNFNEPGAGVELQEVDTLINVLRLRHETTNTQIEQLYNELSVTDLNNTILGDEHPLNSRIREVNETLRGLEARKEAGGAHMQRLEESRNLAWEAYQTLLIKQAEAQIAAQTLGTEVRFASPAIQPQRPISKQMVLKLVVAVSLSFGLSVFAIVAWEWWSSRFHTISNEIES